MANLWTGISMAEDAATAATGVASAAYFLGRALRLRRRRRLAALLLGALVLGAALDAFEQIAVGEGGAAHALVRAPLLLACVGAALVVVGSARR